MSTFILSWVIIGALIMVAYILFFVDIDSRWADSFVGYPLVYLFTIFLWPATILGVLWLKLTVPSGVRRR